MFSAGEVLPLKSDLAQEVADSPAEGMAGGGTEGVVGFEAGYAVVGPHDGVSYGDVSSNLDGEVLFTERHGVRHSLGAFFMDVTCEHGLTGVEFTGETDAGRGEAYAVINCPPGACGAEREVNKARGTGDHAAKGKEVVVVHFTLQRHV